MFPFLSCPSSKDRITLFIKLGCRSLYMCVLTVQSNLNLRLLQAFSQLALAEVGCAVWREASEGVAFEVHGIGCRFFFFSEYCLVSNKCNPFKKLWGLSHCCGSYDCLELNLWFSKAVSSFRLERWTVLLWISLNWAGLFKAFASECTIVSKYW